MTCEGSVKVIRLRPMKHPSLLGVLALAAFAFGALPAFAEEPTPKRVLLVDDDVTIQAAAKLVVSNYDAALLLKVAIIAESLVTERIDAINPRAAAVRTSNVYVGLVLTMTTGPPC